MMSAPVDRDPSATTTFRRAGAAAGAAGVAAFITGWITGAALRPGYSPVHQAISQLARSQAPHRAVMTGAFIVFGMGVTALGVSVARTWHRTALGLDIALTAVATLAVALFPLSAAGGGAEDTRHAACALVGYVTLAAAPLLGRHAIGLPRTSLPFAAITTICLALSIVAPDTGLWQRLGLTVGDTWLLLLAGRLYLRGRPAERSSAKADAARAR